MQTLQQKRAQHALKQVKSWITLNDGSKLKARSSELPFMVHANGLGQAAAFFKSKGQKDGYNFVFIALERWLCESSGPFGSQQNPASANKKPVDLMQSIVDADLHTYRMAQAEAIHYMDWIKKFASAYLSE